MPVSSLTVQGIGYTRSLGTKDALGSPLLDSNFQYENWNKWEMVAFGIYLSNFCVPMVDSYETAFTLSGAESGLSGSKGLGLKALQFGGGQDTEGDKALKAMVKYAVPAQKAATRKINAVYQNYEMGEDGLKAVGEPERRVATIKDLLLANSAVSDQPYVSGKAQKQVGDITVQVPSGMRLCKLVIAGAAAGQDEVIFDWSNGWDAQSMNAWLVRLSASEYAEQGARNLKSVMESKGELRLDNFGNIVTLINGSPVVVYPASTNIHLTKNFRYNLLNSLMLGGNYAKSSTRSMIKTYSTLRDKATQSSKISTTEKENQGALILYYDTTNGMLKSSYKGSTPHYGKVFEDMVRADINNERGSAIGFSLETLNAGAEAGGGIVNFFKQVWNGPGLADIIKSMEDGVGTLSNVALIEGGYPVLSQIYTPRGKAKLFGSPAYITMNAGEKSVTFPKRLVLHNAMKYLEGTRAIQNGNFGLKDPNSELTELGGKSTVESLANHFWFRGSAASPLARESFTSLGSESEILWNPKKDRKGTLLDPKTTFSKINKLKKKGPNLEVTSDESRTMMKRVVKVYTRSDTMQSAMDVLGIQEGTEFGVWAPHIYRTYLEWYGVIGTQGQQFNPNVFKESMDILNTKGTELFTGVFMTKEEKEAEVLNWSYMMLHPEHGKEYRANMIESGFNDFLYKNYKKLVHGNKYGQLRRDSVVGSSSSSGFLSVDNYQTNFLTKWFMEGYAKYGIILIGILGIAIFIVGVITRKRPAWYIISFVVMINILLVLPSIGEITPYVANKVVEKMFATKMTYWNMAEQIDNARLEKQVSEQKSEGDESDLTLADYTRMLNVVYLDRSIMIRSDISKKVTEDSTKVMSDIQNLASARWLLPTMIRQFSSEDGSKNYVVQPVGDVYDNMSNLYWVYQPDDKLVSQTSTSNSTNIGAEYKPDISVGSKSARYAGYQVTSMENTKSQESSYFGQSDLDYDTTEDEVIEEIEETEEEALSDAEKYQVSLTEYKQNNKELRRELKKHQSKETINITTGLNRGRTYYIASSQGLLDLQTDGGLLIAMNEFGEDPKENLGLEEDTETEKTVNVTETTEAQNTTVEVADPLAGFMQYTWDSVCRVKGDEELPHTAFYMINNLRLPDVSTGNFDSLLEQSNITREELLKVSAELEAKASIYQPTKEGAYPEYGYLWATENQMHYFYQLVKSTFKTGRKLSAFAGDLQGAYKISTTTGKEERLSFMHYRDTGLARDVLDLQELFTNMVPYLYGMQVVAGGKDGTEGLVGDAYMVNYPLYKNNRKSWLFRSNWVTKIVEDRDLTRRAKVRLGKESWTVENPLFPANYPKERPMIFSRAEMVAKGMSEADLSLAELKCIRANDEIVKEWTLLLNYVNTPDITTEVFYRQMATDATIVFNRVFSPDRGFNAEKALLPVSLDLRTVSFDSVMKMLMINTTRDASYIYGDTMKAIISSFDLITAAFLLLSAFLSAFVIPLVRNLVTASILFLAIWSMAVNILAGRKTKFKIIAGAFLSNLVFLIGTLLYFGVFAFLITFSTPDSLLKFGNTAVSAGSPVWIFLLVILVSFAYIIFTYRFLKMLFVNYRDMGMEVYGAWSGLIADKLSGGIRNVKSAVSSFNAGFNKASAGTVAYRQEQKLKDQKRYDKRTKARNKANRYTFNKQVAPVNENITNIINQKITAGGGGKAPAKDNTHRVIQDKKE